MNKYLLGTAIGIIALIMIFTFLRNSDSPQALNTIQRLDANAFMALVKDPEVNIIDVRTPDEFSAGHIEGAINIDFYAPDFREQIGVLEKNGKYAIYCRSGNRSGQALSIMKALGFTNVSDLKVGYASLN